MQTIGDAVARLDAALFVGRDREIAIFRDWLESPSDSPTILNVFGPGGIGKSTLVRTFLRLAQEQGRSTLLADAHHFHLSSDGMVRTLGETTVDAVIERLNRDGGLLVLDTFDAVGELSTFLLEEFLPRLSTQVRVLISGRNALGLQWQTSGAFRRLIRSLPLSSLTTPESRDYLCRRGIVDGSAVAQILAVAGGHPLTLSVAADLVQQFGVRNIRAAPEWKVSLASLVDQILRGVSHAELRELLDVCAILRRFDEAALSAISARAEIRDAFERLARLSFVRPADRGYTLHDEIRRLLVEDLKNRRPERYRELRNQAFKYFRQRMRDHPEERASLLMDRFFLWEDSFIQSLLFTAVEPAGMYFDEGGPDNLDELIEVEYGFLHDVLPKFASLEWSDGFDSPATYRSHLALLLQQKDTRCRILRHQSGLALGFAITVQLSGDSLPLLLEDPCLSPLLRSKRVSGELAAVMRTTDPSNIFYEARFACRNYENLNDTVILSELLRDHFGVLARGGLYLASGLVDTYSTQLKAMGYVVVPDVDETWGGVPITGYVLDLRQVGVDAWIEAITNGRPLVEPLPFTEVEAELHRALVHWQDDGLLSQSPLLGLPAFAVAEAPDSQTLREHIRNCLREATAVATIKDRAALQAIELSYLTDGPSNEQAAERLNVSRATYYRWLRRGATLLAHAINRPSP